MSHKRSVSHILFTVLGIVVFLSLVRIDHFTSEAARLNQTAAYNSYLPLIPKRGNVIYSSHGLLGHSIFAECNPGGDSNCACSQEDALISSFTDYGEVTSNVREANTYVNAIGYKKFIEVFPDIDPITLGVYRYSGEFRLPVLPAPDLDQRENPQAIHLMIQFWDGRNELLPVNDHTLEGTIYWDLNPWTVDAGKIKIYTYPLDLMDTGLYLQPDTEWHRFSLVIDLNSQKFVSVTIDDQTVYLSNIGLARVYHDDWGNDLSISLTTESMAAWPQADCTYIFKWTTQFRNLVFIKLD
jgi:hypothetical protein